VTGSHPRSRRTAVAAVAAGAAVIATAAGAWAAWTAPGTGSATAAVATLNPPTAVTASQPNPAIASVHVSWTNPAQIAGITVTGYFVQRLAGATASAACASSAGSPLAPTTHCDDATTTGTYTYKVTAVYRSWTATSSASNAIAVTADTTPPNAPTGLTLTSSSDTGTSATDGITKNSAPTFTGAAEANATITLVSNGTTVGTGTTDGSGTFTATVAPALADGAYTITAKATDAAGNTSAPSTSKSITIDTVAPVISITSITAASGHVVTVAGSGSHGANDVLTATATYCDSSSCSNALGTKTGPINSSTGTWNASSNNLGNGTSVWARATEQDLAGNIGTSAIAGPVTT